MHSRNKGDIYFSLMASKNKAPATIPRTQIACAVQLLSPVVI
jgi:hypothetical protein